jgi:hypothetical protein
MLPEMEQIFYGGIPAGLRRRRFMLLKETIEWIMPVMQKQCMVRIPEIPES